MTTVEEMPPKMKRFIARYERRNVEAKNKKRRNKGIRHAARNAELDEICLAQKWKCFLCGGPMRKRPNPRFRGLHATLEHVLPISRGGTNRKTNLAGAHAKCNHEKGSMTLDEYRVAKAMETQSAMTEGHGPKDDSPVPKGFAQGDGS